MSKINLSAKKVAYLGISLALMEIGKIALDFLPNVEVITLLFIVFTIFYGWNTLLIAAGFILIECCFKGIHIWTLMYLYIWPLLIVLVYIANKHKAGHLFYCILSGLFGLFFGLMCTIPYVFFGGINTAFAWWVAGIPYDIIHCVSNFIICLVLFKPLCSIMKKTLARPDSYPE